MYSINNNSRYYCKKNRIYMEAMKDDEIEIAVQVNGKTRAVINVPADIAKDDVIAQGREAVKDKLAGNIVKEIYVPGRIVNIVCK